MGDRLAIDGGTPVRATLLPYGRHHIDDADIAAVSAALRSDWLTTGPTVEAFEEAFAAYCGVKYAVAVNSGTAALHVACHAIGMDARTEAIVPSMTFVSTPNAVRYCQAHVRITDVDAESLMLTPETAQASMMPLTRAVIPVDFAGQPANMDELRRLCIEKKYLMVLDAAHSLGARYKGLPVGQHAHVTAFSLHPVKSMTSGEGGVAVTNDEEIARKMRAFRTHGIASSPRERAAKGEWYYEMNALGFNYRIPDILCALGLSQLKKLDGFIARRREIDARYRAAFKELPGVRMLAQLPDRESACHLFPILFDLDLFRVDRAQIFRALRAEGIGVNVHYIPVHLHPYYRRIGYGPGMCPVAESAYERIITLPLWPHMTEGDTNDVIAAVHKVVEAYRA